MSTTPEPTLLFSLFMFTADMRPDDPAYTAALVGHMRKLRDMGYAGFDLPVAPPAAAPDFCRDRDRYAAVRDALDKAGLGDVTLTTNVGATRTFDPSSMYGEQRTQALAYLKSRVDITKVLRAGVLAGPVVLPYGVFPTTDGGQPVWSDALHDWVPPRYTNAQLILRELGDYAATQGVSVAIEPVDHWETPAPNMVGEVLQFLDGVASPAVGVCVDSAHVVLGGDGPAEYAAQIKQAAEKKRLQYVHLSAPDRGALHDSWIPWKPFLTPVLEAGFDGPYLVEVFNAIPVFLNSLRLTRRKFLIPGEDELISGRPTAYDIAEKGLAEVKRQFAELRRADP